ncbi:hypothetical protein FMM05_07050 [Flavobacterium zepuense]|uniref:Methyltransferase domain-containing protein n=1 Tax=Flavobacterium zepuense TaxID=2593302 RepID=A0A552V696_9FLAO|nr:hypothetical protein [Flavobacterium zepuense]TRW25972.1 hypothetical protein FMM05_07050 [Flavobacterium zepuense]
MSFINRLSNASNSSEDLTEFIQNNSIEIYDFFISQRNSSIIIHKTEIENYILPKYITFRQLDFTDSKNQTFLFCLMDVSQRFGLATEFQQLFNLANQHNVSLNSRLNATSKFLIGINTISDYENIINEVLSNLSASFLKEEDNEQKTIATLIQYYTEVFYNFGQQNIERVIEFRNKLLEELQKEEYKFLYTKSIYEVLSYSLDNIDDLYQAVHTKLDEILERASQYLAFNIEPHLIELDTHYSHLLTEISANFSEIRNLCVELYSVVSSDEIFRSLQRGVKVLTEQNQLLAYLHSYGKMHQAKMISAIRPIEEKDLQEELEVYDWGCGQGLASVCFLEHLINQETHYSIKNFTLIEPSEIAIKRASLHIRKFTKKTQIITINKDLDSLESTDFESKENNTKIHLFSNILDVDLFSMSDLINLIKDNFKGKNIFICVSPHVSNFKTERIDSFVDSFSNNLNFKLIADISERNGEWVGTTWSRVIRVFKLSF